MKKSVLGCLLGLILTPVQAQTIFTESEPNNNIPKANFINTNDSSILVRGDRFDNNRSSDWFKIWGQRDGKLDLLLRTNHAFAGATPRDSDPIIGLFDSNGRELAFSDNVNGVFGLNAGIFNYHLMSTGYYYIAVSARKDRNFRGGGAGGQQSKWSYGISITRTTAPEPSEWTLIGLGALSVLGLMKRAAQKAQNM
jgi:hypothetical protein